jgi:selenocysteine-specific elongation factor
VVERYLIQNSDKYPEKKSILKAVGHMAADQFDSIVAALMDKKLVYEFRAGDDSYLLHERYLKDVETKLTEILEAYHKRNPLKSGISKEELKTRLFEGIKPKLADMLFGFYEASGIIKISS